MPEGVYVEKEMAARLQAQIAAVQKDLGDRLDRIEKALLGDREIGLTGMVERVQELDREARSATDAHQAMEDRRREGDKRLHERIDKLERSWAKAVWLGVGVSIGSAGGTAWLTHLLTGGECVTVTHPPPYSGAAGRG